MPIIARPRGARRLGEIVFLLLLVLAVTSCAETSREVIARLTPAYRNKRAELARLARELPPPGSVRKVELPASLEPPIVIVEDTPDINTDVWPIELLTDPDAKRTGAEPIRDFWTYPNNLIFCLGWTGPHNPLDESRMDAAAGEGMSRCRQTLDQPYLLAVRTLRYEPPEAVAIEAFLIDLRSGGVRAQFPMSYRNPNYHGEAAPRPSTGGAQAESSDHFSSVMRCGLVTALQRLPGSRIRVGRGCKPSGPEVRYEPLAAEPTLVAPTSTDPLPLRQAPP